MKYKIGVFGSAEEDFKKILKRTQSLGQALGEKQVVVITGASTGVPYEVASTAKRAGATLWRFSAATNFKDQVLIAPDCDSTIYDKLVYIPRTYEFVSSRQVCRKYRNVTSCATCDAGIIISGRWGTLNEFTNLYDMGKIIGILTGTGGIADELPKLCRTISKKSNAKVIFSKSPKKLVETVIQELRVRK